MKVLVLGVSGMAGHVIALYFKEKGHEVVGFSTSPFAHCRNLVGNVFDFDPLKKHMLLEDYDAVINCIGILNQFAENNHSAAVYLNSYLPHLLADTLRGVKTKLIHMSTDCVFAGNTGPYSENSFPDGKTFYDRSKALGEFDDNKNLTFRNSIIGPDMKESGIGLFNWFMKQKSTLNGFTGAIWTGVTTLTLAQAMEAAIEQNLCGLYNLVNNQNISKYDLISLFNKYFRNDELIISENDALKLDKTLINNRNDFAFSVPSYEQMVIDMNSWILKYSHLYPHYQ
jgi:dTDP-4-dehydrorhamnose reductase